MLRAIEAGGWVVEKGAKHWWAQCSCGRHQAGIYNTPASDKYFSNRLRWFQKTCWEGESK
jgi:hypothetical protein